MNTAGRNLGEFSRAYELEAGNLRVYMYIHFCIYLAWGLFIVRGARIKLGAKSYLTYKLIERVIPAVLVTKTCLSTPRSGV
jgi:hypothetical protein